MESITFELQKEKERLLIKLGLLETIVDRIEKIGEPTFKCKFITEYERFDIFRIEDLHNARAWLSKLFDGWEDKMVHTFFSCGRFHTVWLGTNGWELWLESKVDSLPKEILGTCRIEKRVSQENDYSIVCDM